MYKLINNLKLFFLIIISFILIVKTVNAEFCSVQEASLHPRLEGGAQRSMVYLTQKEKQWLEQHPVIRLASNSYWPPLEYMGKDGSYQGIAADFIALIEKKLAIRFVRSPDQLWNDSIQDIRERRLDVLSMAMETSARQEFARFTRPYISNAMVIVTRDSVSYVSGIQGLIGKTVAVVEGFASFDTLSAEHPGILIKPYPNVEKALSAVTNGDTFAFVGNIITVGYIIQEKSLSHLRVSGDTPYRFELGIGVRSDWPELVSILDKALDSITVRERAEIFSRWVYVDIGHGIYWKIVLWAFGILGSFTLIILYWNYQLNRKVKQRTALLEHQALHDVLTGLPNRMAMHSRLEQQIYTAEREKGSLFAVLFIDLDDFKKVNDTLGHAVGDELLLAVADRLRKTLRRSDFISRFGGDEFVVITQIVRQKSSLETVCRHMLEVMQKAYCLRGQTVTIHMSIGAACYAENGATAEALLRHADTAMYAAKKQGRNRFIFYSKEVEPSAERRMEKSAEGTSVEYEHSLLKTVPEKS
ncbi:hypothetical protein CSW98_00280 [Vibrio sp. HA2012]|uniref:diguanylate cyclase domain-containing protein n=1 Tax=Vibrio sp. HA2012 TaxID=1971595 RepID=UPI000C2BBA2A|nr:diguanylate cyclase [Vibrio sp. HA2012]PJC87600.1 hypothetical protein CSW98_00280 [Vibrio sp. HA2012]